MLGSCEYKVLTGFSRAEFKDIVSTVTYINSSTSRSKRTCVVILLLKLRSSLFNKMLAVLFNIINKNPKNISLSICLKVFNIILNVRNIFFRSGVPFNLPEQHL